ncbi:MAG: tryptophan--tRNA ligase [Alphaproteobacteria bacterium]|nr:tryptophan--tRNA ligase [Alphaproteobacteria bacterium]
MTEMDTFLQATKKSDLIKEEIEKNPKEFRVLTGDRPTGSLHIGHYFGSLQNRVRLMEKGVPLFILIADYQVLTDHDAFDKIAENTRDLVLDYLSVGLDPFHEEVCIFPHSQIPELNQLLVPFLTLVSQAELERNPTVKEEIQASNLSNVNAGMLVYPVHQACDILALQGNVVPVGKDQLPHLELTRTIAKRFNRKFKSDKPVFVSPSALLAEVPTILGLDGVQKMSKSRNNAIMLRMTKDEIAGVVKKAQTDSERLITYEPERRPHVANLLSLISLMEGKTSPDKIASEIGEGGAKVLKERLVESTDAFLTPFREKRAFYEKDNDLIRQILKQGSDQARAIASDTLDKTRKAMNMALSF